MNEVKLFVVAGKTGHNKGCETVAKLNGDIIPINTARYSKEVAIMNTVHSQGIYLTADWQKDETAKVLHKVAEVLGKKIICAKSN